jgi:hypothetical protein
VVLILEENKNYFAPRARRPRGALRGRNYFFVFLVVKPKNTEIVV